MKKCKEQVKSCVLVGTYRPENVDWIKRKKLYNLPLPSLGKMAFHDQITQIVLIAEGFPSLAYMTRLREVVDVAWLKGNGYKVAAKGNEHGDYYALYELTKKLSVPSVLSNPKATVFVSSSRCPHVKIDADFYAKPYPKMGGKSMPYIFDKLKPYFKKWQGAETFDPIQEDFFDDLRWMRKTDVPFPPIENPKFKFIDLFAGIGGFRLAMQINGGECVFSSEWNESAKKTYFENYGEMPYGDITKEETKERIPCGFDVLCAGFPCQPFSIAGVSKKRSLGRATGFEDKTQGTLFFDVCSILKRKRPKAFLLENVKNLCSHDKGNTFRVIMESLRELDYEVFYEVIDGRYFVPQHRERILLVGFDRRRYGDTVKFGFDIKKRTPAPKVADILEDRPDGKYTLTDKLWGYLQRYAEKHRAAGNGFGFGIAPLDGVSRTLSARYYKDGSEILIEQKAKNPRRLTPRECARLMGYPDEFKIVVSDCQAYRQFGNSVVMPLMADVSRLIVTKLKELEGGVNV